MSFVSAMPEVQGKSSAGYTKYGEAQQYIFSMMAQE
jgi:hypothetical protein